MCVDGWDVWVGVCGGWLGGGWIRVVVGWVRSGLSLGLGDRGDGNWDGVKL